MSDSMATLGALPAGVAEAEGLLRALDACFMVGFSRLGQEHVEGLVSVQRTFTGTPLGERLAEAVEAITRAEFVERHFVTIAAARASLQGAQYDALADQLAGALGTTRVAAATSEVVEPSGPVGTWMESARHWLMEIALGGLLQLDGDVLAPFSATLEQLQQEPQAARLGMLLTGMLGEWMRVLPVGAMPVVPARRWVDLWTRAMISAIGTEAQAATTAVSGEVRIVGVDLRHHANAVSVVAHGVLGDGEGAQHVRITRSAYKVDVITGGEMWQVLDSDEPLYKAIVGEKVLKVDGVPLTDAGDLLLARGAGEVSRKKVDVWATAREHLAPGAHAPLADQPPRDRHPVQLGALVFLDAPTFAKRGDEVVTEVSGATLRLATERLSPTGGLASHSFTSGADQLIGLVRFDGGQWAIQPLVAQKGKKTLHNAEGADASRSSTISTLQERASKLLRAKS